MGFAKNLILLDQDFTQSTEWIHCSFMQTKRCCLKLCLFGLFFLLFDVFIENIYIFDALRLLNYDNRMTTFLIRFIRIRLTFVFYRFIQWLIFNVLLVFYPLLSLVIGILFVLYCAFRILFHVIKQSSQAYLTHILFLLWKIFHRLGRCLIVLRIFMVS